MTRTKLCGITSVNDAKAAVDAGADAIGLVFYAKSSRYVSLAAAADIAQAVGPFVTVTGLFVNAPAEQVWRTLRRVPLHLLQFHGDESARYCEQFARPYIKAVRMKPNVDVTAACREHPKAVGVLLDAYRPGVPGGTGDRFDWQRIPEALPLPLVLAGGLNPDNVAEAVAQTQPYAVDVSGGIEQSPGVKSHEAIRAFVSRVKNAE